MNVTYVKRDGKQFVGFLEEYSLQPRSILLDQSSRVRAPGTEFVEHAAPTDAANHLSVE
jgi:hypothetical protein